MTAVDAPGPRLGEGLSCRAIEGTVCDVWSAFFGADVSRYDDFFDLGGDSLSIIDTVDELRKRGIPARTSVALRNPTPARLAEGLTVRNERAPAPGRAAFPGLLPGAGGVTRARPSTGAGRPTTLPGSRGAAPPLFLVHSDSHRQMEREAAAAWRLDCPVVCLPAPGATGPLPPQATLADIANRHVDVLLAEQRHGPYRVAGFGYSAVLAFEMARTLRRRGHEVALLAMVLSPAPGPACGLPPGLDEILDVRCTALARRFALTGGEDSDEVLARTRAAGWYDSDLRPEDLARLQLAWAQLAYAVRGYEPGAYDGPVVFCADELDAPAVESWGSVVADARVHLFGYGLESPVPVLGDPRLGDILREELAR